jgi:hypothetical protein
MTLGISTVNLANKWLDVLGASTFTGITTVYVKLHTGDPGAAGTASASAEVTRKAVTWSVASAGSKAMSGTLSWSSWSAGAETISHVSLWDNSTGGNFIWSGQLATSKAVGNGDTLNITALTASITPLAA